jgi:hypothetical protein
MTPKDTGPAAVASRHAFRHALRADGRESLAHMLMFPEHGIAGFIYPTMRAAGPAKARAALFGPALTAAVTEEIEQKIPPGADFADWSTGPLHMAVRDPHRIVDLAWNGDRIGFAGTYEALHPAYAFSSHPGGNPPYYGDDRTEQHGRLTCQVSVDGLAFHHQGYLIRDHSWGPRIWGLNQHHKWFHAVTSSQSLHVFEMQSFGSTHLRGYLWQDGTMRHVTSFDYDLAYDDAMMQRSIHARIVDSDGRKADVVGETFAAIRLEWDPAVYLCEAALRTRIEGEEGVGWAEFCWNRNYFDFASQHVGRFGPQAMPRASLG